MLENHLNLISSYTKELYGFDKLQEAIQDYYLVLFGESCHGVADFNSIMSDIVTSLHDIGKCDVVAFEAGLGECFNAYYQASSMVAEELVKSCMYLSSKCEEVLPLFNYVKEARGTCHPLYTIGIDPRPLNPSNNWLLDLVRHNDYDCIYILAETENMVKRWGRRGFIQDDISKKEYEEYRDICSNNYMDLLDFLINRKEEGADTGDEDMALTVARRVIENRVGILDVLSDEADYYEYREEAMADNICWIKNELFPDKRVIVWGHSGHTRKRGSKTDAALSMCERFSSKGCQDYYSVGMFAHGGRAAWNNREEYELVPVPEHSIEDRIHVENGAVFIDLHKLFEEGEAWVNDPCYALSWGVEPEQLVPIEQFDGVLVASEVNPPRFL